MATQPHASLTQAPRVPDQPTQSLCGDVITDAWPEGLTIQGYLERLAAAGEIELVNDADIIWCERCGAATDRGACGCIRYVRRVG